MVNRGFGLWQCLGAGATKAFKQKKTSAALAISGHSPLTSVTGTAKKSLEVVRDVLPHSAYTDGKFSGAPMPDNEPERIGYLCALNVLDTPPDPRFDSITSLACLMFKVPIALVSLVDNDRQWFKSVQGLSTDHTDRKSSFCAWTLLPEHPEVLVVPDATKDARFVNNQLVTGPPDIRFYAGSPLVCSNGMRMGSLCIIDRIPRVFSADECMMLANLSEMVVRELEKEKLLADQKAMSVALEQENTQLLRAIDAFSEGIMLCNVTKSQWPVEFINEAFEQLTGFTKADLGNGFWSFFKVAAPDIPAIQSQYRRAIEERDAFELTVYFTDELKQKRFLTMQMRCANLDSLNEMAAVGIPSSLQDTAAEEEGRNTYYFATLSQSQMSEAPNSPARSRLSSASGSISAGNAFVLLDNHKDNPCDDVKLGQLLGRGSYGRVYRGRWNGAQVAVKILDWVDSQEEGDGGGKEMMEALLSTQLSHPNVVQTFKHFGREVGRNSEDNAMMETWMVMDFCNKGGLTDAIDRGDFRKRGAMFECDFRAFLTTAREIASAMCYLHSCRIIHGDLTANNILLASSEKDQRGFLVKVCDFGLSRVLEGKESMRTRTMGTVTHMPPELINEGTVSQACDTYAFGVILWEMYMGERPWRGLNHSQIISAISSGKQLQLGGNCPAMLRKFITKCTSTKPAERPTFVQVLKDLEDLEDDLVGTTGDS